MCNDKHLKLIYQPEAASKEKNISIKDRIFEEEKRRGKIENHGFHRVERLPGNIGYLDTLLKIPMLLF